jgi:hypothetical protein
MRRSVSTRRVCQPGRLYPVKAELTGFVALNARPWSTQGANGNPIATENCSVRIDHGRLTGAKLATITFVIAGEVALAPATYRQPPGGISAVRQPCLSGARSSSLPRRVRSRTIAGQCQ